MAHEHRAGATVPDFHHEIIEGAHGPCKSYSGIAAAIRTFNGTPVILMAATRSALVDAIKEINPNTKVNTDAFIPASIIHDHYIKRKDNEL